MELDEFATMLLEGAAKAEKIPPSTTVCIDEVGDAVELFTDNKASYYGQWIQGEGADICLYRERETDKLVGVRLPLRYKRLIVGRIPRASHEPLDAQAAADNHDGA